MDYLHEPYLFYYLHEPYLFYYNLVIVTYNDKRTIEKDGYRIDVVPVTEF